MAMETKQLKQSPNRPTQSVERWINEDPNSAAFWRGEAFSLCSELGVLDCFDADRRDRAGVQLAERLREETKEASPLRGFDPYAEFVNAAIDVVDWYGIAQALIGKVCHEIGTAYRAELAESGEGE